MDNVKVVVHALDADTALVEASGEIDSATAPRFQAALYSALDGASALVVDLSAVTFIASTGIGAVVSAYAETTDRGAAFAVVTGEGRVAHRIRLMGLHKMVVLHSTREAALEALRG